MPKDYLLEKYNKRYSAYSFKQKYFTVFRVGDKIRDIESLERLQKHCNRECDIDNVDSSRSHLNRILIGNEDFVKDIKEYLIGVKLRDNSIIARELILSAGKGFYERMPPQQQELWIQQNIKFLKNNFGENCVYAVLHLDETTPHIHAYIVPKFYNEKKKYYQLNSSYYFDGKDKLSQWQDKYTDCMLEKFSCFIRGIKGSKAKHIDLKTYYSLIKEDLNVYDSQQVQAYAKENFINKKKVEELQEQVLENEATIEACNKILENNKKLKDNEKLYKHTIRILSLKYNIPEDQVLKIMEEKKKEDGKIKGKQRER